MAESAGSEGCEEQGARSQRSEGRNQKVKGQRTEDRSREPETRSEEIGRGGRSGRPDRPGGPELQGGMFVPQFAGYSTQFAGSGWPTRPSVLARDLHDDHGETGQIVDTIVSQKWPVVWGAKTESPVGRGATATGVLRSADRNRHGLSFWFQSPMRITPDGQIFVTIVTRFWPCNGIPEQMTLQESPQAVQFAIARNELRRI